MWLCINFIWLLHELWTVHAQIDTVSTKNDLYFLKKLLAFRISGLPNATAFSSTTLPPLFTAAFLSTIATDAPSLQPLQSEFENFLANNITLDGKIKKAFLKAAPMLKGFGKSENLSAEEAATRHHALMEMAMEIKPLVEPFVSGIGANLSERITSVGQRFFPETNRTGRGGGGWGWGGWGGGGGGGGSCCCCGWGGGGGGGGGGWGGGGGNNDALLYSLLSKNGNSDLSQLLPLLFGLIALLIMKLPT